MSPTPPDRFVPRPLQPGDRKVVLSRLLAEAEVHRLGIVPTRTEICEVALWWQRQYGVEEPARFSAWLEYADLDLERFIAMMRRFAALMKLVRHYHADIEAALPDHLAVHSIHDFLRRDGARGP